MSRLARSASEAGDDLDVVRRDAERGWEGSAGGAFAGHTVTYRNGADAMHEGGDVVARGLARHADDLAEVRDKLDDARRVARAAGLSTSEAEIADPGPAPSQPGPLPPDATADQVDARNLAVQAVSAHQTQALAFQDAQRTVAAARAAQQKSQSILIELLGGTRSRWGCN